jgi:hypothetical protein
MIRSEMPMIFQTEIPTVNAVAINEFPILKHVNSIRASLYKARYIQQLVDIELKCRHDELERLQGVLKGKIISDCTNLKELVNLVSELHSIDLADCIEEFNLSLGNVQSLKQEIELVKINSEELAIELSVLESKVIDTSRNDLASRHTHEKPLQSFTFWAKQALNIIGDYAPKSIKISQAFSKNGIDKLRHKVRFIQLTKKYRHYPCIDFIAKATPSEILQFAQNKALEIESNFAASKMCRRRTRDVATKLSDNQSKLLSLEDKLHRLSTGKERNIALYKFIEDKLNTALLCPIDLDLLSIMLNCRHVFHEYSLVNAKILALKQGKSVINGEVLRASRQLVRFNNAFFSKRQQLLVTIYDQSNTTDYTCALKTDQNETDWNIDTFSRTLQEILLVDSLKKLDELAITSKNESNLQFPDSVFSLHSLESILINMTNAMSKQCGEHQMSDTIQWEGFIHA